MVVTLQQIADRAGLSQPAVSKILNGKAATYRPETRRKVLKLATDMGYRPNAAGRAMATQRFGAIAILLGSDRNVSPLLGSLLDGIESEAMRHDLYVTLARLPDARLTDSTYLPKILRECFADGLLIDYQAEIPPAMKRLLAQSRLPAIWLNTNRPEDCVHPDDVSAGRLATEHLIQLGHRRIAYLDYSCNYADLGRFLPSASAHYCTSDRLNGYLEVMRDANLAPRLIASERTIPRNQRVEYSRRWLTAPDRPTAVVAWSVSAALPVIHAATLVGLRVPRDLSLVACHDRVSDEMGVCLTTALIPLAETGVEAVRMLREKIERPATKLAVRVLPVHLEPGGTTAPPALPDVSTSS